ncbi:ribonuclease P protein subunit p25b [Pimephales promelas]|uniref:ribonuclease P protein subunit p25b n=1 Tax=Pimephales promelas TaxID=90988 RepID=UPI001955EA45|nr:ribonuclease P protein subunit p25b [Pimephales promelas]
MEMEPSDAGRDTSAQIKQAHAGGFKKVCRIEEDSVCPFPGLAADVLEMRVKEGSKIRNLMGFAMTRMQDGLRQVVFSGSGRAVTKTITCAEITKRKIAGLHQITKLQYRGLREIWESQDGGDSEMTIHRTLPSIRILLSKDPLDPLEPGYQPPALREGEASHAPGKRPLDSPDSPTLGKRVCL